VTHSTNILKLLDINPSRECRNYVRNKTQFQLHHLPTEQRHPLTWNFSVIAENDAEAGLRMLMEVDKDIAVRLEEWARQPGLLEQAADAVKSVLLSGRKIYIYGCGATGRLAKQMESTFWRPFWKRVRADKKIHEKIRDWPGNPPEVRLTGEMTGGDRALISSLEGFEDLELIGRLQLQNHGIRMGDMVICVTEGGETSSVIGTILAARDQWKESGDTYHQNSRRYLYFIYNNPDAELSSLARCRRVLDEPGISRINLTTGPQAIAGSTRMQAATIETYVIGHIIQSGVEQALREFLTEKEMCRLGFSAISSFTGKLKHFRTLLEDIQRSVPALARLTEREADTYAGGGKAAYFACESLITVFIDSTERSPTFRLYPLDTVDRKKRRCWIQIWTGAAGQSEAWLSFLGRPFQGLEPEIYRKPFENKISDSFLRRAALRSLQQAGDDQQRLYDFSLSRFNLKHRRPQPEDFGLAVTLDAERPQWRNSGFGFRRFIRILKETQIPKNILVVTEGDVSQWKRTIQNIPGWNSNRDLAVLAAAAATPNDPMGVNRHCTLKMILNAHSTAVMARLGRVTGNTMAHVQPANLKLIGRAVYLVQSHVNEILTQTPPLDYEEAAAVLFEAMEFLKTGPDAGQPAEVPLSVIRILESLRRSAPITQEEALEIVKQTGLKDYIKNVESA
jgi:N-acetylmuramic acid 6-phosphate etherase